jgi:hypothetical protein
MEIHAPARNFFLNPIGQGKQLVAVSKQLQVWDFKEVIKWVGKGHRWTPCAHWRPALQCASREDDWCLQEADVKKLGNEKVLS